MKRRTIVWLALVLLAAAALAFLRFGGGDVPAGQPPLATLDAASLGTLRDDFNRAAGKVRIIVLLSPT